MILTDYQIGAIGAIKVSADDGRVRLDEDSNGNKVVYYSEQGTDMVAVIDSFSKTTHCMTVETYTNPSTEVSQLLETVGIIADENTSSSKYTEKVESPDENNESA